MNEFSARVLALQKDGFDFMEGKSGYKRETRMVKQSEASSHYDVCVVTLWDDDTVTDHCQKISRRAVHAGFVQR